MQVRIKEETDAFEEILDKVRDDKLALLSSDILVYEVLNIFSLHKKTEIERYLFLCERRVEEDEGVKELAILIRNRCGIKDRDALHLASAIVGDAEYCLTCDDNVTKEKSVKCIEKIAGEYGKKLVVLNPKDFIGGTR